MTGLPTWKGNHILIEFPLRSPEKMGSIVPEDEIRKLVEAGFQPVLAHPERYLWASPADYARWRAAGAYTFLGSDLHNRRYAEFFDEFCGEERPCS